jgi:hypothetical protein
MKKGILLALFLLLITIIFSSLAARVIEPGKRGAFLIDEFMKECAFQQNCAEIFRDSGDDEICKMHLESDILWQINQEINIASSEIPEYLPVHGIKKQPSCPLVVY